MRKKRLFIIAAMAVAALLCVAWFSNPLRRPDASIRAWLLKRTPLGVSSEEVRGVAERHGWSCSDMQQGSDGRTSGPYLRGELGEYWSVPFYTSVTVFWSFDSSNRLTDLRIWKTTDGL